MRSQSAQVLSATLLLFVLPGVGFAQSAPPVVVEENPGCANCQQSSRDGWVLHRGRNWDVGVAAGPVGPGYWHSGYPYGPRVAPAWGYPGLGGGPFIGYPGGYYGYSGRVGDFWSNGLSLYGPPVPVYGPIPGVFGNNDLVKRWETHPAGLPLGWIGVYAASPRPRHLTVGVRPHAESVPIAPTTFPAAPAASAAAPEQPTAGALILSVRVPQPAAEVFVDGVKTTQTGTDRVFESPLLEAGKQFKYEVTAKWIEGGAVREVKKAVVGMPGEVVRVDFTTGN